MEIYVTVLIENTPYTVAVKTRFRKIIWTKAFKAKKGLTMEVPILKVRTSTTKEELTYWHRNLHRKLIKNRKE